MSTPNGNLLMVSWRKGDISSPYVSISEPVIVANKMWFLSEIPDLYNRVVISGLVETQSTIVNSGQYYVDYNRGIVFFHDDQDGLSFTASYYGKGIISIYASRVLSQDGGGSVTGTLQEIIDDANTVITDAETATTNAINATDAANTATTNTNAAIANANSFQWKGLWSASTTYAKNESVSKDNTSYISLQDNNLNQTPIVGGTAYWSVLAEKGSSLDPILDNSLTIKTSSDATKNVIIQLSSVSGGLEFVINN